MDKICIMMPLYNDWQSAALLIPRIDKAVASWDCRVTLLVVDDGSQESMPEPAEWIGAAIHLDEVRVIHLARNQGHQRAIAVGLAYAHTRNCFSSIFVMDSDGEDPPEALTDLRRVSRRHPHAIITADRAGRCEGPLFRLGYRCYRLLFRLLTGATIRFGNFSCIPAVQLERLVHYDDLWNSYSGCIKKSRLPVVGTPSDRATRYIGPSKMNLTALLLHGLGAIAVFQEVVLLRLLAVPVLIAMAGIALWPVAAGGVLAWTPFLLLGVSAGSGAILLAATLDQLHRRNRLGQGPVHLWQSQIRAITALREAGASLNDAPSPEHPADNDGAFGKAV